MNLRVLAFTDKGLILAESLARTLGGSAQRCAPPLTLASWTANAFQQADALVYVGAAGIAVRAVAPHVHSKDCDPAVVVVDECGRFVVPILSGHLGGANNLARRIAAVCGGMAVITTATDANGVFAVDSWAVRQGCAVLDVSRIKTISAKLLAGGQVTVQSPWSVAGTPPQGVHLGKPGDVEVTVYSADRGALRLVPRIAVLGVGCRRGTTEAVLHKAFENLLQTSGLCEKAFYKVCTIDLKKDEPGLQTFCRQRGLSLECFDADRLREVQGSFSSSDFVREVTGVDNVCERSAVLGSGGTLCWKKQVGNGVTMAVALAPFAPDWRWKDE